MLALAASRACVQAAASASSAPGVVIDWRQASRDAASDFSSDSRAASGTRAETQASYFCR